MFYLSMLQWVSEKFFLSLLHIYSFLQFSSLGSLDEKWMAELAFSMSSGVSEDKMPLGLGEPLIVWPSVEDVRCSLEVEYSSDRICYVFNRLLELMISKYMYFCLTYYLIELLVGCFQ